MRIRYDCLVCGAALESPTEDAGRFAACPSCGTESTVPHDDHDDDPIAARRAERAAKSRVRLALLFGGCAAVVAVVVAAVLEAQSKQPRHAVEAPATVEKAAKPAAVPKPAPRPVPPPKPAPGVALKDITEEEDVGVAAPRPDPVVGPRKKSPYFDTTLPFEPADFPPAPKKK